MFGLVQEMGMYVFMMVRLKLSFLLFRIDNLKPNIGILN